VLAAECLATQLAAVCYRLQFKALPASFFRAYILSILLFFVCVGAGTNSTNLGLLSFFTKDLIVFRKLNVFAWTRSTFLFIIILCLIVSCLAPLAQRVEERIV
jgi:hypothetical protein